MKRSLLAAAVMVAALGVVKPAQATIVERVVAVIGEQAIFFSDLRNRAKPVLLQMYQNLPAGPQRNAYESQLYKDLLEHMVDEKLYAVAAERARLTVTTDEVDRGLKDVAASQGYKDDLPGFLAEVIRSGFTLQEFRDEVRRQLLEQKLLSLRVNPRVKVSPEDIQVGYAKMQREERKRLNYRVSWIVIHTKASATEEEKLAARKKADEVAARASSGEDFAKLAESFSDDGKTRKNGGDLGSAKPGSWNTQLGQVIDETTIQLDVGQASPPVEYRGDFLIFKVTDRDQGRLPPLAKAQELVLNTVFGERREKARKQWLEELKRSVYVDVRL